jgi:peptidoglycan/xylan/chitin deacetylase (PgdA/CDA1 family)
MIYQIQQSGLSYWFLLFPLVFYIFLLILGSAVISFNFYFQSLCRIKTDKKIVALTFDDGPHPEITPQVLSLLEKYDVNASFFCLGKNIAKFKSMIKEIDQKGHLIGNHSYTHHRWFDLFSSSKMVAEIKATNAEIEKVIHRKPLLFRPPYGVTNPSLRKALMRTEMIPVGWSVRSFDTIRSNESVLKKLRTRTKAGDVILFHDTNEKIIQILDEYLAWLKDEGFNIVSLEQMFDINAYEAL